MNTNIPYKTPSFKNNAFNCPFCQAYTHQEWGYVRDLTTNPALALKDQNFATCWCKRCGNFSTWVDKKMVHPPATTAPIPNPDLPQDVRTDYEEARSIFSASPRAAAALLRLAIQKLCVHLGEKGKNINEDIRSLVKKGLPKKIQQALDIVRVVGNHTVHPGQIDLRDDSKIADRLFELVNLIVENMITQPKHINEMYETLPESDRESIDKRDGS